MGVYIKGVDMPKGTNMMLLISPEGEVYEMGDLLGNDKLIEGAKAVGYGGEGKVPVEEKTDAVNHPEHYTSGGIECIDAIRASLGMKEFADYCKGNVIKYVWRYRHKNGVEDLKKARVYLNWMIEAEEGT